MPTPLPLPAERRLTVQGLTWRFLETPGTRDGPALLMLPGTLGTAAIFASTLQALGRRVRIVSLTYPMVEDILRLADGLDGLMRRLDLPRASVVGSSLGGFLAQHFAARHPQRVVQLVLGNTLSDPGLTRSLVGPRSLQSLRAMPATVHRDIVLDSVRSWPDTGAAQRDLKALLIDSGSRLLSPRAMKARVLAVQASPAVPPLSIPASRITVLDCADDPLLPRMVQDSVVQRYPGARHVRLNRGGHYPNVLCTQAYNALLARVLGLD